MLPYPDISPVALSLGPLSIRWYGLMYILTFIIAYFFIPRLISERKLEVKKDFVIDLLFAILLGVILGGRLGYMLFYNLGLYLQNPLEIIKIWNGGLSFHGGLIGVILALIYVSRKEHIKFYRLTDTVIPIAPIGIFLVRIGNFINGELYGRITNSTICIRFPSDSTNCRYPSQLIEAGLEGLLLFFIIFFLKKKIKTNGLLSWIFIAGYGGARFIAEFFREPDVQIGYFFDILTLGQIFSILMLLIAAAGAYTAIPGNSLKSPPHGK